MLALLLLRLIFMKRFIFVTALLLCASLASASVTVTDNSISLSSDSVVMVLSSDNGGITSFIQKGMAKSIIKSSAPGLWSATLAKGQIESTQFSADNADKKFSFEKQGESAVDLIYECQELKAVVHVTEIASGFEFSATTTPADQVLKSIDLPAKLSFDPLIVERFIAPADPDNSVGIAFNKKFFMEQPLNNPTGWRGQSAGPKAFVSLYGKGVQTLSDDKPPVLLKVTKEGVKWLSAEVAKKINAAKLPVVRPQPKEICDLTLVASDNGAYFSGSRLGGKGGYIWRVGAGVRGEEQELIAESVVVATAKKIMAAESAGRGSIALLDLQNGPAGGLWNSTEIKKWRGLLRQALSEFGDRYSFESIKSIPELQKALGSQRHLCIINPYGEGFPAEDEAGLLASMQALKNFVHAGGNWFEVGGYSFYQVLHPDKYIGHEARYPPAYADMFHLKSSHGDIALYRAQPRDVKEPWDAAKQHEKIFIPGMLYCGGDAAGGYMIHSFTTWVKPKQIWTTPKVHLTAGVPLKKTMVDYCHKNSITQPLEKKINAATLAKFKQAPLIYLAGPCKEKMAALESLPVPSLIHFADYLHGGFDKQYPDHLPPNKGFGTQEEFKVFVAALHAKGHLFSPYTNPTWWCDNPKGPTFEREGRAPLLVKADGKNRYEDYNGKTGWTTTLWHPAVQAANRKVVTEFIEDVPVDMLFQDQCGARGFLYDFNTAAPTPYAFSEGMIAMNDEDSRRVPLGTEHGWDRVSNFQTMLCGMTWGIVPTHGGPPWRKCFKEIIPPQTWTIYPLAQAISHDKCIFGHHDLGQFVTDNRSLSWTIAMGYHMSWRGNADFAKHAPSREWYAWLCRIQKTVGARYTGQPLTAFEHDRSPMLQRDIDHREYNDDGVMKVSYGDVKIFANLGPVVRVVDGRRLARYGFYAEAPGMTAGILSNAGDIDETAFVAEHRSGRSDFWVYAAPGDKLSIPLPGESGVKVTLDGRSPITAQVLNGRVELYLPAEEKKIKYVEPPVEEKLRAPCNRPGERPLIGVINLGKGAYPVWARVSVDQWVDAIRKSSLCTLHGLTVTNIASYAELQSALKEGPGRWLAIVNPYGEATLSENKGGWKQTLDAVRGYVNNGGSWWETGGYSFHCEFYREGNSWKNATIGSAGLDYLGLSLSGGAIEIVPERISVTPAGESWLGKPFTERLNKKYAQANRALPMNLQKPATQLIKGERNFYVGGYRLGGWGHLWRIGGMKPESTFATSVMIAATLHQYISPPEPVKIPGTPRLWHAVVEK
jgi:hypothetical protein